MGQRCLRAGSGSMASILPIHGRSHRPAAEVARSTSSGSTCPPWRQSLCWPPGSSSSCLAGFPSSRWRSSCASEACRIQDSSTEPSFHAADPAGQADSSDRRRTGRRRTVSSRTGRLRTFHSRSLHPRSRVPIMHTRRVAWAATPVGQAVEVQRLPGHTGGQSLNRPVAALGMARRITRKVSRFGVMRPRSGKAGTS